jgi:hypothetical protein
MSASDVPPTAHYRLASTPPAAALKNVEREERAPYILTFPEVKLLGIAGVRSYSILPLLLYITDN